MMMVDDDWMDEVLQDGSAATSRYDSDGRPTASLRSVVDQIRDSNDLTEAEIAAKVNEVLAEEVLSVRYSRTLHDVQAEALREHQSSPVVLDPDPSARHPQPTVDELEEQAAAIDATSQREYDEGRTELVEELRRLHEQGFEVSPQVWSELSSLDEDGLVSAELEGLGSLEELSAKAEPKQEAEVPPTGIDFSRDIGDGVAYERERDLARARNREDRQEYVEIEAPIGHAESEAEVAEEKGPQGPDPDVAATIARHKKDAGKRKQGQPQQIGGMMADFFRQYGRNLDGTRIEPVKQQDEGLEL